MIKNDKNNISFDVNIGNNENKRVAFTEMLRQIYSRRYNNTKAVVKATTMSSYKWFTLSQEQNLESTIGHISGEVDIAKNQSDANQFIQRPFMPSSYQIIFLNQNKSNNGVSFKIKRQDSETNRIFNEEIDLHKSFKN